MPSFSCSTVARTQASSALRIACAYSSSMPKIRGKSGTAASIARVNASDEEISASSRAARWVSAPIARSRPSA